MSVRQHETPVISEGGTRRGMKRWMPSRRSSVAVGVAGVLAATAAASVLPAIGLNGPAPKLAAAGPISGDLGFPSWYKDSEGTYLGLCSDPTDAMCAIPADHIPDPTRPASYPDNMPEESFYQLASSVMDTPGGGRFTGVFALEAVSAPDKADNHVFGRVRLWLDVPNAGTYKITHPYGVDTFTIDADDFVPDEDTGQMRRGVRFTEDISPFGFTEALKSRINPFLRWDTGLIEKNGSLYIGDPDVEHKITGSAYDTNFVRIEGPNIGGPGVNVLENDLFSVAGKIAESYGVNAGQPTYAVDADGKPYIDVFSSTEKGMSVQARGDGLSATTLPGDGRGNYSGRLPFDGTVEEARNASVTVVNTADRPQTSSTAKVTDKVVVKSASYDFTTDKLTVVASSSDPSATLDVVGYGPLGNGTFDVTAAPAQVTVTSPYGGSDTAPVVIGAGVIDADPVKVQAGNDLVVPPGARVELDGSASQNYTSLEWSQAGGEAVTLSNATTPVASFTAPITPGDLTIRLTGQGPGGPSTDEVKITVEASAPPTADAGPEQTALVGDTVALNGSATTGAVSYSWTQTEGPTVALTGATTARPSFKMVKSAAPLVFRLEARNAAGEISESFTKVSMTPDTLATTLVEYRRDGREWRIDGTSSILQAQGANTVTAYVGTSNIVIGTGTVDALGEFGIRVRNGVNPGTVRTVRFESTRGGMLTSTLAVRN